MSLITALPQALKELRIHFCKHSPASNGLRNFITHNYPSIKKANPHPPYLFVKHLELKQEYLRDSNMVGKRR
ncbi:uncharacterized protein VTP21DRAFT_5859 [Calcarisporiella thermophila]|uniref:uncharacterized protein n=1 Tax=Calcarisporiella thermophila TaxID=911321 RepID=UPI0037437963